jgi:hypothetical protein
MGGISERPTEKRRLEVSDGGQNRVDRPGGAGGGSWGHKSSCREWQRVEVEQLWTGSDRQEGRRSSTVAGKILAAAAQDGTSTTCGVRSLS